MPVDAASSMQARQSFTLIYIQLTLRSIVSRCTNTDESSEKGKSGKSTEENIIYFNILNLYLCPDVKLVSLIDIHIKIIKLSSFLCFWRKQSNKEENNKMCWRQFLFCFPLRSHKKQIAESVTFACLILIQNPCHMLKVQSKPQGSK